MRFFLQNIFIFIFFNLEIKRNYFVGLLTVQRMESQNRYTKYNYVKGIRGNPKEKRIRRKKKET